MHRPPEIMKTLAKSSAELIVVQPQMETSLTDGESDDTAFRRSTQSFYGLIARNPFGVYLINADFKLVEISLGAQKVFENVRPLHGRDLAEALRFIWPEPFASEAIERFRHTLGTGESYQAPSFRERRADVNVEEAYDWRIERVTLPDGTYGAVCYFYDLSERQRWESALAESEKRFRTLVDTIPALIFVCDPAGLTTYAGPSFHQYSGLSAGQILSFGWLGVIDSDDHERACASWTQSRDSGQIYTNEHRFIDKDGSYRWFLVRICPVFDSDGLITQWVGSATDVQTVVETRNALSRANDQLETNVAARTSELRVANRLLQDEIKQREVTMAALAQAQKLEALGQLTSGIAHDFNNIVAAIAGGFSVIVRRTTDPRITEIARHGVNAAERGAGLVKQLLAFAQHQVLTPTIVDVCDMLKDVRPLLQRAVGPQTDLTIECSQEIGHVRIDQVMLETALINLAINARDAMPSGGMLRIEARRTRMGDDNWPPEFSAQEAIVITVVDEGSGMPAEILQRVMEPFFTTKGPGKGTGLGLAMVHGFSEQSGGTFRIESTVGRGTSASIYLPRVSEADKLSVGMDELSDIGCPRAPDDLNDTTILVVDDDDHVSAVVCAQLEDFGYKTIAASSGAAALIMIADQSGIDAVLSDVMMPGMDGMTLAAILRRIRPDLPILFMTGHADREQLIGEHVLDKPFTATSLAQGVRVLLTQSVDNVPHETKSNKK